MSEENQVVSFDSAGIQACQLNRYPLLFIDRIIEAVPGEYANGIKNFTFNEWFFPEHFDGDPNVPGFVQVECLEQTFLMTFLCFDEYKRKNTTTIAIDNVKFGKGLFPGDTLEVFAILDSFRRGIARGHVQSFVKTEPVCSAEFTVAILDILKQFNPTLKKEQS